MLRVLPGELKPACLQELHRAVDREQLRLHLRRGVAKDGQMRKPAACVVPDMLGDGI